jgi:hypothetical protein
MLNKLVRRVFEKFAPSKAAISVILLKLGTLLDSVNAPLLSFDISPRDARQGKGCIDE